VAREARIEAAFESVLAAGQAGAPWAFDRLWRAYAPAVVSYLSVQGIFDPEDLVSEVFLGAFRGIGGFRGNEDQFRGWLFTIAHRRVTDERRRATVRPQAAGSIAGQRDMAVPDRRGGDVEEDALRRLAEDRVRALCEDLQSGQRDVLLLRLIADLTVDQVAEALGKTPGAVKALQRRGLASLRTILQHEGVPL